jgi:hypothetical protein
VAFSRKVYDSIKPFPEDLAHKASVCYIPTYEPVARVGMKVSQVVRVAGIRKGIKICEFEVWVSCKLQAHEVCTDESAATSDQDLLHRVRILPTLVADGARLQTALAVLHT